MDAIAIDDPAELMRALAAAEGGARIEIAAGTYPAPTFGDLDFDTAVIVTSANPGDPAVFHGATRISGSRNLVLSGVALEADGAMSDPVLTIAHSRGIVVDGITLTGYVPGPEGADPHAATTGRMQPITGFGFGEGVRIGGGVEVTLSDTEIAGVRRAIDVFDSRAVSLERLEIHDVREGLNLHDVTGLRLVDSHFHGFNSWLPMGSPGFDGAIHDHADMVQYWGRGSKTGVHDVTITGNLFEQTPGTSTQTIFGHLGGAPDHVTASDFTVTGNVILNGHPHAIRLGGVEGGRITGNVLLPNAPGVPLGWSPRIQLTGGASDIVVSGNVMLRPNGRDHLVNWNDAALAGSGITLEDNQFLSTGRGNGLYWQTWKTRHLDPVLDGLRR